VLFVIPSIFITPVFEIFFKSFLTYTNLWFLTLHPKTFRSRSTTLRRKSLARHNAKKIHLESNDISFILLVLDNLLNDLAVVNETYYLYPDFGKQVVQVDLGCALQAAAGVTGSQTTEQLKRK